MKPFVRIALVVGIVASLSSASAVLPAGADPGTQVEVSGILHQGEPGQVVYRAIKPASWNGTLVLDLDFNTWPANQQAWFLGHGYAIGGNQRTQNQTAYEIHDYVDNLVTTREKLIDAGVSAPTRTIYIGASRGGFVGRVAVEYRPDVFDGAVVFAGGGGGLVATWNSKSDSVWALKHLVDPNSSVAVANLPDGTLSPAYAQDVALGQLVAKARATTQGLARLALAAAFEQTPTWSSPGTAQPGPRDYEAHLNQIAANYVFGNPQFVHKEIEIMAGGSFTWNRGVDYRDLLDRSGLRPLVEYWYAKAGLDLDADLAGLAGAPRFDADPAAVHRAEQQSTYTGRVEGPILSVHTIGDPADEVSSEVGYRDTFDAAGTREELRTAYVGRAGHSSQSLLEVVTAFQTLVERLDAGTWPATSAAALNARAGQIASESTLPLGASQYIEFDPAPPVRTWDFRDWGNYFPSYVSSLGLDRPEEFVAALDNMAKHWRSGQTDQACKELADFTKKASKESGKKLSATESAEFVASAGRLASALGC